MSDNITELSIDVFSDVVCPWCYIGKRHLARALELLAAQRPDLQPIVRWRPFELNPDIPLEGIDRAAYLTQKFGGPESARGMYARVRAAGENAGLALDFDAIRRQPNTRDAHRLIEWISADSAAIADRLVESLFHAYFVEGRFIGQRDELSAIASSLGLDADEARSMLDSDEYLASVQAAERRAHTLGIRGVPFFIFGGRIGVSGAQPPEVLYDAGLQALVHDPHVA